jgi:phosphatidate cytidylyltransferase
MTSVMLTLTLLILFLVEIIKQKVSKSLERISISYLGAFLLAWCFAHLLLIRDLRPHGLNCLLYLFILIWLADTSAYLFGTRFGKRKLAKKISPKKTIEGLFGAFFVSVPVSLCFNFFAFKTYYPKMIFLGLMLVALAQLSDLTESLLKREAGIKDTDNLLPGHGGMLDRFDSFLFTAPFLYYFLLFFPI